jgi:sugar phosphate isomerase/epimerase
MMKPEIKVGVNGAFLTRRWEEPENWMRLTRECGFQYHSFCADVLDPFFSGDREYQIETARQVRQFAEQYGVTISDVYTGVATHRFHGLSHSDPRVRKRMMEWIEQCADLALEMGTDAVGGHWDAFSVEVLADPVRTRERWDMLMTTFRDLADTFKRKGLRAIYQEQMYIPGEKPWTLAEAEQFLVAVNQESAGVPVYLTLDTGHAAGMHYGLTGADTDYLEWLRRFASVSEVIHLQQTTPEASHHWSFTPEFNARGCVQIQAVLEAIEESFAFHASRPYAFMPPVERIYLMAEIIPGSTKTEETLLAELKETADYIRQFVPH